jgi:hypothetical protein
VLLPITHHVELFSFMKSRNGNEGWFWEHHDPIHVLVSMFAEHEQVDHIQVEDSFDRDVWDEVVPLNASLHTRCHAVVFSLGVHNVT